MKQFPIESGHWGNAITLLNYASFPKQDTRCLATYYLLARPMPQATYTACLENCLDLQAC